tara:strand:- start:774 stop:977 length:204 start_codon:yes stop_codon:yes gene_type:complete
MAELPATVGDLVLVIESVGAHRGLPALVVDVDTAGWFCVQWDDGEALWFPSAKLQVISRGSKKDEEK